MLATIFVFYLVSAALGAPNPPSLDIIGGVNIEISKAPYQLALYVYGHSACGAVLIARNWALTAAHCVEKRAPGDLTIQAGSALRLLGTGQSVSVSNIILHYQYDEETVENDIALIHLATAVTLNLNASLVALPLANQAVPTGTNVFVTGWGSDAVDGDFSDTLKGVQVPVKDWEFCSEDFEPGELPDSVFCGGEPNKTGSCNGDSGGAAVSNGTLLGIVSSKRDCASDTHPGLYTRVSAFVAWIKDITGIN